MKITQEFCVSCKYNQYGSNTFQKDQIIMFEENSKDDQIMKKAKKGEFDEQFFNSFDSLNKLDKEKILEGKNFKIIFENIFKKK